MSGSTPKKPKKLTPAQAVALPPAEYLKHRLLDLEQRLAAGSPNLAALVSASRLATNLRAELAALEQPVAVATGDDHGIGDLPDEALLDKLVSAIGELPDEAVDLLEDAIVARRTGKPVLTLVQGPS